MNIDGSTYRQWVEDRDKWYVSTLVEHGVLPEDILQGKWDQHCISVKVDIIKEVEILCIKGEPIGEPHRLHPEAIVRIVADYNKSKLIVPDHYKNN